MTLTWEWPWYNQGAGSETWLKWKNSDMTALTDISNLKTISTGNYAYEYYPNINLCVYIKQNSVDDRLVSLASFPTSDDVRTFRLSWIHIVQADKVNR